MRIATRDQCLHVLITSTVIFLIVFCCRRTGILVFGPPTDPDVLSTARSLASGNVPYEELSGREANRRYPQQLKLPEDHRCVFEEGGGILNAQRAVLAFQVKLYCLQHSRSVCAFFLHSCLKSQSNFHA